MKIMRTKILSLLIILMGLCLLPAIALAANESSIQLGADGIARRDEIYFGKYRYRDVVFDIQWLVLHKGEDEVFVLSKYLLGESQFASSSAGYYKDSRLNEVMNDFYNGETKLFTSVEQHTIIEKKDLTCVDGMVDDEASPSIDSAHLYPLSFSEAEAQRWESDTLKALSILDPDGKPKDWWLRSSSAPNYAFCIIDDGGWANYSLTESAHVRPAFNLNMNFVLFTSPAAGGKPSGTGALNTNLPPDDAASWKLTLLDDTRSFDVSTTAVSTTKAGGDVSIAYSGASVGTNEYLSAMLTGGSGASETVLYYGRLKRIASAADVSGTQTIAVPALKPGTYTLKIFNEQCSNDLSPDYSSALKNVTLTVSAPAASSAVNIAGVNLLTNKYYKCAKNVLTADGTSSDYNAWYEDSTNTLHLNNLIITEYNGMCIHTDYDDLIIDLTGTSTVSTSASSPDHAVYIPDGKLTIQGTGSLSATANGSSALISGVYVGKDIMAWSGTLTGTGGNTTEKSGKSYGIYASTGIEVLESTLVGNGGTAAGERGRSCGVYANGGNIKLSDTGTLIGTGGRVTGKNGFSHGVATNTGGKIIVYGSRCTLTGIGGEVTEAEGESYGVGAGGDIEISRGTLTGMGGEAKGPEGESYGVYLNSGDLFVSGVCVLAGTGGNAAGTDGKSYGVYANSAAAPDKGNIEVSGGTLTGEGKTGSSSYGVRAIKNITVSGGMLKGMGGTVMNPSGESSGVSAGGSITLAGGTTIAQSTPAEKTYAFNKQPNFDTPNTWYRWRIGDSGDYTFSGAAQYVRDAVHTYVEICSADPIIQTVSLPGGTAGAAYSQTVSASGSGTIMLSLVGSLPAGLVFTPTSAEASASAAISGTLPKTAGSYPFAIKAFNSLGGTDTRQYTIEVSEAAALSGTVQITGTLKYGEELTAALSGGNNSGTLSYQWKRGSANGTDIGTGGKYTLAQDDIGQTIYCVITSSVETGSVSGSTSAAIGKADGPAAPVELSGIAPTAYGGADGRIIGLVSTNLYEYTATPDEPAGWTPVGANAAEITGLAADTYTVRLRETATHLPGGSAAVTVPSGAAAQLAAPANLVWDSTAAGTASWSTVTNAGSYRVQLYKHGTAQTDKIGGEISVTAVSSSFASAIDANGTGTYFFMVKAVSSSPAYSDSDWAASGGYDYTAPAAPTISVQPSGQSVIEGRSAAFSVTAEGNPAPSYQWYINRNDDNGWVELSGAVSASYSTGATVLSDSGYQYRCVVSNGISPNVTSDTAVLTVTAAITPQAVLTSGSAAFTVGNAAQDAVFTIGAGIAGFNAANNYDYTKVGGTVLNDSQVTAADGSIILTFSRTYLNTLPAGTSAAMVYLKGAGYAGLVVSIPLTVYPAATPPKTGDNFMPILWLTLGLLGGVGLLIVTHRNKRNRYMGKR